ncbi:MAG: KEOPS complex kinase/ATPase Bud32 [Candidatus Heimdallarchaeota archaeon]
MLKENFRGAESKLYIKDWLDLPAIYKQRMAKTYRIKELDFYFRKQRTIHEAKLLDKAKSLAGVKTPFIYEIDIPQTTIVMELVEGEQLKNLLPSFKTKKREAICKEVGRNVGKLHRANIIHGDLTTSNILLSSKNNDLVFVDFGLGYISDRLEDSGIDVYLLERAFISTHEDIYEDSWNAIIQGYKETSQFGGQIEEKLREIASRGRYSERM